MSNILEWTKEYGLQKLKGDVSAGITTGIVLIPQGMAYALIAGLPPVHGLYAALIPPVIYALLGTSYHLSVGPVATVSLLIFAGLSELGITGTDMATYAALLALMTGGIQLVFGSIRMGFIVNFLSRPVISGYTSAAALIIGVSQLNNLTGANFSLETDFNRSLILQYFGAIHWPTLLVGLLTIFLLITLKSINRKWPGAVIVVVLSILIVYYFDLEHHIRIIGNVPAGLPEFEWPPTGLPEMKPLISLALIIAMVGYIESISISKKLQTRHKDYKIDANRELTALGMANIAGGLFSAFPVSGGLSRSAVHEEAGANTPLSLVFGSMLIGLTLLLLTPVFYYLPKSVLAAIIIVAVAGLIDLREARILWQVSKRDFWMMLTTVMVTLVFGIQEGIVAGVLLSLVMVIYKSTNPHSAVLGKLPDTNYYRNVNRFPEASARSDALIFRFDAQLYFANIQYFVDTLTSLIRDKKPQPSVIVINAQAIHALDMSAVYGLKELIGNLHQQGFVLYFTEVIGPVRDVMKKAGIYDMIGPEHFHMRVQDALDHFDMKNPSASSYASQSNE